MSSIGVMIPRRRPLVETMRELRNHGVSMVQLWCLDNEIDVRRPEGVSVGRVMESVAALDMRISALCCDTGRGFVNPATLDEQMALLASAAELCRKMGVGILTSHVGSFDADDHAQMQCLIATLRRAGDLCADSGVVFATETGAESGSRLLVLLESVDHPNVRVNFDPANLVRRGFDLEEAVRLLGPYIAHAHAKDGVKGGPEVVIGEGDVPWANYLGWMARANYRGPTVIEREAGADWLGDVMVGKRLLDNITPVAARGMTPAFS